MTKQTRRTARIGDLPICTVILLDTRDGLLEYETQGLVVGDQSVASLGGRMPNGRLPGDVDAPVSVRVLPVGHDRRHCDVPARCEVEVVG
jgi:hypothetical protein